MHQSRYSEGAISLVNGSATDKSLRFGEPLHQIYHMFPVGVAKRAYLCLYDIVDLICRTSRGQVECFA